MCLIVKVPAGTDLPMDVIESALSWNDDGFGIMYDGNAKKWKELTAEKIDAIIKDGKDFDRAVHFRMATDGKINKANAHPFKLKNRSWLMHNGVLSKYKTSRKAEKSDTRRFIDEWANPQIAKHGSIPVVSLESEIWGSAVCIMDKTGNIQTYGNGWTSHYGCKFSNEYAWDAPGRWDKYSTSGNWGKYSTSGIGLVDYEDSEVIINRGADDDTADLLASMLYQIADDLPLNTPDLVAYQDMHLYDDMLAGQLDEGEFLECCSGESLVFLYGWAVRNDRLPT